jgi:hypothetical protein
VTSVNTIHMIGTTDLCIIKIWGKMTMQYLVLTVELKGH